MVVSCIFFRTQPHVTRSQWYTWLIFCRQVDCGHPQGHFWGSKPVPAKLSKHRLIHRQGCGLGLDVSSSRRTNVSVSGGRRLVSVSASCQRPTQDHHHRYRADLYRAGEAVVGAVYIQLSDSTNVTGEWHCCVSVALCKDNSLNKKWLWAASFSAHSPMSQEVSDIPGWYSMVPVHKQFPDGHADGAVVWTDFRRCKPKPML